MLFQDIARSVYAYGSFQDGRYGYLTFQPDGCVGHYKHPNEHRFTIHANTLNFWDENGECRNDQLEFEPDTYSLYSTEKYLRPVLKLESAVTAASMPPVFVNSIPKAGTYLLELVLSRLGLKPLSLHLSSDFFDDNRHCASHDIHKAPHLRRTACPATAIASLMLPGEAVVGHIGSSHALSDIGRCCSLVHLVRNLRDVLVSLYRFKLSKVEALDPADKLWRILPEPQRFVGFLVYSLSTDIPYLSSVVTAILSRREGTIIRYEDLRYPDTAKDVYTGISLALGVRTTAFFSTLQKTIGVVTPTLSPSPTTPMNLRNLWDDHVESYFRATGLFALNQRLGYEA